MGEAEVTTGSSHGVQNEGILTKPKTVRLGDEYRLPIRRPGPAELIRAVQRDNDFISRLTLDLNETIHEIFGQKGLNKWNSLGQSKSFPILLYLSLTNLSGLQTIGEEYVGVIQLDKSGVKLPGKKSVLGMIFLSAYGGQLMNYFLTTTERFLLRHTLMLQTNLSDNKRSCFEELELRTKRTILAASSFFKRNIPFLSQVHLTLFFNSGRFYEIAKRLTGIHFVLVRNWYASQDKESRRNVRYLVWLSVFNSIFTIATVSADFMRTNKISETDFNVNYDPDKVFSSAGGLQQDPCRVEVPGRKCSLCLENGKDWSVTPCGHLFCWTCIMDWLRTKQECPVCRDSFKPSRILPLLNLK